jgi:hypothetical protein
MRVVQAASLGQSRYKASRSDDEPDSQARMHDLRKCSHVSHDANSVEALQRFERTRFKAILTVVVVFDDARLPFGGPTQKSELAIERHRHAERELMGRSDVDQAGFGGQVVYLQSL